MSKMQLALKRVQEQRDLATKEPEVTQPRLQPKKEGARFTINTTLLVIFVAVAVSSLLINIRTAGVLKKTRTAADMLAMHFTGQGDELDEVKILLKEIKMNRDVEVQALKSQVRELKFITKKRDQDVKGIRSTQDDLKERVNTVYRSVESLNTQYTNIAEEVHEIKEIKQKQAKFNELFSEYNVRKE